MITVLLSGQGNPNIFNSYKEWLKIDSIREKIKFLSIVYNCDLIKLFTDENHKQLNTFEMQIGLSAIFISVFDYVQSLIPEIRIRINYVCGHSAGEISALYLSNLYIREIISLISEIRGRSILKYLDNDYSMLAVQAPLDGPMNSKLRAYNLSISNINSIEQIVLSGKREDLLRFKEECNSIRSTLLKMDGGGYHTDVLLESSKEFSIIKYFTKNKSKSFIGHIINIDGSVVYDTERIVNNIVEQVHKMVRWDKCIYQMKLLNEKRFLEFPPCNVLSNLVKKNIDNVDIFKLDSIDKLDYLKEWLNRN